MLQTNYTHVIHHMSSLINKTPPIKLNSFHPSHRPTPILAPQNTRNGKKRIKAEKVSRGKVKDKGKERTK